MGNQRPPGGSDEPTNDPQRERVGGTPRPAQPWVDANPTVRYSGRRSIADRLRGESREPEPPSQESTALPEPAPAPQRPPRARFATPAQVRAASRRSGGGLRLAAILGGVIVLGLAGGAAAAWFSGWRPGFLGGAPQEPAKAPADKPAATPGETKPGGPTTTPAPQGGEIGRSCFSGVTEVKAGAAACGFALDAAGALSFKGERIVERLAAGSGAAQRVMLYPFSPSARFVFLRACESASGGGCAVQRLVDTKEKKVSEMKGGGEGYGWVAWSPKEQIVLLGFKDGLSDTMAIVSTAGEMLRPSAIRTARNRYALIRPESVRWARDEQSFAVEVKLCPLKNRARNPDCEQDEDVKFRRRTVKFER